MRLKKHSPLHSWGQASASPSSADTCVLKKLTNACEECGDLSDKPLICKADGYMGEFQASESA